MGVAQLIKNVVAGYPGGYKQARRGTQGLWDAPPFQQPTDLNDLRSRIPPLGHREYWYPALPTKDVPKKKPAILRLLGEDIVFFWGKDGEVKALREACPHRGAYLSMGDCFYNGTVTCPYHGATFDGDGNCVAFLTEGPDSKMVGEIKAWTYPTVTIKNMVFVWMGKGEPVDPSEDVPPEMFEENTIVRYSFSIFNCNWMIVLENTNDAHNAFFVHRNCVTVLRSRTGGRPRTPLGYRTKIINGKAATFNAGGGGVAPTERYYFDENGKMPYQLYYPGVDGVWPLHKYRLMWTWFFERRQNRRRGNAGAVNRSMRNQNVDNEWQGTHLPGMSRTGGANPLFRSTRWPVPVELNMTRMVYLNVERYKTKPGVVRKIWSGLKWPTKNWMLNYNFRNPDYDAERTCQYNMPEYLSATDSTVVAIRKLVAEYGRGNMRVEELTREDELVLERNDEVIEDSKSAYAEQIKEGFAKIR